MEVSSLFNNEKMKKWYQKEQTVTLLGLGGQVLGNVTKSDYTENSVVVPTFLIGRLSNISSNDLVSQKLLNSLVLLSLAEDDMDNSAMLLQLTPHQRLGKLIVSLQKRTNLYDLKICAAFLRGKSLDVAGEYFHVDLIT